MSDRSDTKKFPEGFYWGAATSSFQTEGGIENMDWAKYAREGRVPEIGNACDFYNRYESDFDIAKQLGHNCHRISIEWSRIEPVEGTFDEKEIKHYLDVLAALRARHIKPFITIWHFTLPLWFSESGGFERKDAPEIFARYCGYVAKKLGNDCRHFATINEPLPYASNGWRRGTWPPFKKWPGIDRIGVPGYKNPHSSKHDVSWRNILRYFRVLKQLAKAHNLAYDEIKKNAFGAEVGIVHHVVLFHANANPINKLLAWFMNWHWTHQLMGRIHHKCDSIGVNYYMHKKFGDTATYEKTDMGWDVYPEGLCNALLLVKRYGKPVWVAEAGVADAADSIRADYIKRLIRCMHVAMEKGVDVRGFMYWSLLDNYELAHGYTKKFGLVEVDFKTQERKIRPSAYVYKEIIEHNGLVD
ncbi:glycoside hydrolase family 1 protein [Candidatus Kaiserbacteria bacterium]|nr:glycoside hydrolase family 1 protein [Candidatus Kaiserbacteria bacterium]